MNEQSLTIEGKTYIIKRLTAKEKFEILGVAKDKKEFESNVLAVQKSLVSPIMTKDEIENMDGTHFDYIVIKILDFNSVGAFLEKPSPPQSSTPAGTEKQS